MIVSKRYVKELEEKVNALQIENTYLKGAITTHEDMLTKLGQTVRSFKTLPQNIAEYKISLLGLERELNTFEISSRNIQYNLNSLKGDKS